MTRGAALVAAALFGLALVWAGPASACTSDDDCPVGIRCEREPGEVYGTCTGIAPAPPPAEDEVPPTPPVYDPGQGPGRSCRHPVDCPPGYRCMKNPGSIDGVCVE